MRKYLVFLLVFLLTSVFASKEATQREITIKSGEEVKITDGTEDISIVPLDNGDNLDGENGIVSAGVMFGRVNSSTVKAVRIDGVSDALCVLDYEHCEVHEGNHYFISGFEAENVDGTIIFTVTTPNTTKWAHMTFQITSNKAFTFQVYEGAGTISGGSTATPINNNRNSDNTSILTIKKDPTVGSAGTLIDSYKIGNSAGGSLADFGGITSRDRELILKQDETYQFKITSNDDSATISYIGEWYEHTNAN